MLNSTYIFLSGTPEESHGRRVHGPSTNGEIGAQRIKNKDEGKGNNCQYPNPTKYPRPSKATSPNVLEQAVLQSGMTYMDMPQVAIIIIIDAARILEAVPAKPHSQEGPHGET
eukprot:5390368-Amphidinium_carterae.1